MQQDSVPQPKKQTTKILYSLQIVVSALNRPWLFGFFPNHFQLPNAIINAFLERSE